VRGVLRITRWRPDADYCAESVDRLLRFIIEPGARVLRIRQPDPAPVNLPDRFDYILVDALSATIDVAAAITRLTPLCEPHSRVIVCGYDGGRRGPAADDVCRLLETAGFRVVRARRLVLLPIRIPFVSELVNRVAACLPLVSKLGKVSVVVARPEPTAVCADSVSVSVVVPCRNERGNVAAAVARIPRLGRHTEILFCDDRSTDGTADEVRRAIAEHPERDIRLIDGPGICKADNVWTGFRASRGDILVILDADLEVMPEELPQFVRALTEGRAELANGSRMVYPMQKSAMSWNRVVGNRMFSAIFSYLLDQPVNDTLCGTKALWRRDWQRIEAQLGSWGVKDRWGDHELLLGAARLQLAIVDVPVHYQNRISGVSKMVGLTSNLLRMLRLCIAAGSRLKTGS
jgi:glycosyl transferase family 2